MIHTVYSQYVNVFFKFDEYEAIDRQLLADQEKELEYLNGLDQPINKADLPLLCPEEDSNGPPMNEPMKLRYTNSYLSKPSFSN